MAGGDYIRGRDPGDETDNYLRRLGRRVIAINEANGWSVLEPDDWNEPYRVPTSLALIHSEVSEALEHFRAHEWEEFEVELADILIRVLDLAEGLGVDLHRRVDEKLMKNQARGYRHGGKRV